MTKRRVKAVDALMLAIERERGARALYLGAASRASDPDGQRMFNWLAEEEYRHMAALKRQLDSLLEHDKWLEPGSAISPVERTEFPPASEAIRTHGVDTDEERILLQAMESEEESILFYREAEESTPDLGGKSMFRLLAEEERGHLTLLQGELEWVTKYRKYFGLPRFAAPS
jgi:rubrerythrin